MKNIFFLLLIIAILFVIDYCTAQTIDTVIHTPVYTSYFSKKYAQPLYVEYKLYKGGGNCSRIGYSFKNDIKSLKTLTAKDYTGSGYDEGHLCNAEDEAGSSKTEEATFRFYNAIPQTPNLNRGVWKQYETLARQLSQTDSLTIICGGYDYTKESHFYVPLHNFKIVKDLKTGKIIYCLSFVNKPSASCAALPIKQLLKKTGYKISL